MCLILLAWRAHPEYPLVFAGNRDEAYERPSAAADFWSDEPGIFGGRDLEKGGTWLGLTLSGRIAAVTNYRDGRAAKTAPRSRGELTADFLRGADTSRAYLERVAPRAADHGGYTLIVGDFDDLYCHSNRGAGIQELATGVHGLSNHLLDTPWPKVALGKQRVSALLKAGETELIAGLFGALSDRTAALDPELPDSGVGLQRERELSPAFIAGDRYGTRASTVVLISRNAEAVFAERRFGPRGAPLGETVRRLALQRRVTWPPGKTAGQTV
jgi:uncharacterized protein with NRDE domain